ncbi:MAG: hypothetical protein IT290_08885 [Deltaproteobacteria bacterium]|nr:hypothetical protein [Deltaproteobacteria bacterium]
MVARVTNQQQVSTFVEQMYRGRADLEEARKRVASGLEIEKPSDDPGRAGTIALFQTTVTRLTEHKERIGYAQSFLEQQEVVTTSAQEMVLRAKELANQAASESLGVDERQILAQEVFALRDQMVNMANSQFQGVYIYGGNDDDDPPFDQFPVPPPGTYVAGYQGPGYTVPSTGAASFRYGWDQESGTSTTRETQISDFERVRTTTSGAFWQQPIAALERLGRALDGYRTNPPVPYNSPGTVGMPDGTGAAYTQPTDFDVQTNDLLRLVDELEFSRKQILTEQTSLGGRLNQLRQSNDIITQVIDKTDEARANIQDADPFEAATLFSNLQISFEALLASGSRINNLSLLNYL